ncbi:MAG TPA: hypothetical protein VM866_09580 [Pyrinomonadaceae bacterium]|nr:hypothetical protein [Pyrinomonadaceae bacterium]
MRKSLSLLLLLLLTSQATPPLIAADSQDAAKNIQQSQSPSDRLKNQDVLDMLKAGLSPEVVIAKIKSSAGAFDTSPRTLQELKMAGVPEAVVLAMIKSLPKTDDRFAGGHLPRKAVTLKVADGTPVEIESAFDVSSASVKAGELISFRVVAPVRVDGATVVAADALATGKIVEAKKAGRWGRAGQIAWSLENVIAVDGRPLQLKSESRVKGEGRTGEVATKTAVNAALLIPVFPIAPLALLHGFKKGAEAILPAGKRFTAYVKGGSTVNTTGETIIGER